MSSPSLGLGAGRISDNATAAELRNQPDEGHEPHSADPPPRKDLLDQESSGDIGRCSSEVQPKFSSRRGFSSVHRMPCSYVWSLAPFRRDLSIVGRIIVDQRPGSARPICYDPVQEGQFGCVYRLLLAPGVKVDPGFAATLGEFGCDL